MGLRTEMRDGVGMYALFWHYGARFDVERLRILGSLELNHCVVVWMLDRGRNFYSRCLVAC
jgi:hypothetical protein